jgi:hypothetical protein
MPVLKKEEDEHGDRNGTTHGTSGMEGAKKPTVVKSVNCIFVISSPLLPGAGSATWDWMAAS